jgi:Rrf2 family iron-sulfur cluster assembly transcriptional regulator
MDLTLTRRGDYIVRAAIALARAFPHGGYRKIREVAEEMRLPRAYTPQILNALAQAQLAEARAGQRGGYRLRRDPATISLLEVVEAAEGPLRPERCTLRDGPCRWDDVCALHPAWDQAVGALRRALGATTLAVVSDVDARLEAGDFPLTAPVHRQQRPR